jgi:hypothetical protein
MKDTETQVKTNIIYSKQDLQEKSQIYGKNGARQCSKYEEAINNAVYELCVDDGTLINNRKLLFEKAREKVNASGYNYKKTMSRSKAFMGEQSASENKPKRIKLEHEIRQKRTLRAVNKPWCY